MITSPTTPFSDEPRASARVTEPIGGVLRTYYAQVAAHEIMQKGQEFDLARELRRTERATWATLLAFTPLRPQVLKIARRRLKEELRPGTPRRLAAQIQRHDPDRAALDAALNRFDEALERGSLRCEEAARRVRRRVDRQDRAARRARDAFVAANLRLVVHLVGKYEPWLLETEELVQEGNLGLIEAVGRFDPDRGCRFSTYASFWIRHRISRALSNKGRTVRLPVHRAQRGGRLLRLKHELTASLGRAPTYAELAGVVGQDPADVERELGRITGVTHSLDAPLNGCGEGGDRWLETFAAEESLDGFRRVDDHDLIRLVRREIPELSEREREALDLRFGIDGQRTLTLREIGERWGLSRERVRQIQTRALRRIRRRLTRRDPALAPEGDVSINADYAT